MTENYFGITDTGKVRGNNEDAFIAGRVMNNRFTLACVIDGVGGYSGGEVAADIARKSILDYFSTPSGEIISMMKDSFILANDKIYEEKQHVKEHDSMACVLTLAIIDLENNQFYYAHVGDTRLYLLRDKSLVKLSKDHSFVGFLEDTGRLSEDAAMRHPKRNEINKALGFGMQPKNTDDYIETGQSPFLPGDMLLLCSDGLTDMVNKSDITSILVSDSSLEEKGKQLIDAANKGGGKDNITVVLVHNDKPPVQQEATKPSGVKKKEILNDQSTPPALTKNREKSVVLPNKKKKRKWLIPFLALGGVLIIASLLWWKNREPKQNEEETMIMQMRETRNAQEIKLQATINTLIGDTLFLSDSVFTQPLIISDTITISRDSLYIKSSGNMVLKRDSAYSGPAILLSENCKHIVIDSLLFEDFNVGILVFNNALQLKDVRFNNCSTAVQTMFTFPANRYVTGRIMDISFKTDSIPNKINE